MNKTQHTAFYISHDGDKEWLLQQLATGDKLNGLMHLNELTGEIFSNTTLQYFIDEELKHDHFEIIAGKNNRLAASSSGEQRKALLTYIIDKRPGYIIIDSLFESLDKDARQSISSMLHKVAGHTLIIQLFNRKHELLPFIDDIYTLGLRSLADPQKRDQFLAHVELQQESMFLAAVPPPLTRYILPDHPLVRMNNVNVQFNEKPVLQNICWEINAGEFWQLTGPNGSGKSTLLALITGNSPKGYGQDLWLFGHHKGSGESVWDIKQKMGYFTPAMTMHFERLDSIEQMIISGFFDSVGLYIKPTDSQVRLARQWLSLIGMDKEKHKPFRFFSEAHQRMILIARAMVKHPPLLILDEPTAGLDDDMAALFTGLINRISAETNTAVLYVSHMEEKGLIPGKIFALVPSEDGSIGQVIK